MNRLFEIQTLSDCTPRLKNYINLRNGETPMDPITIITGGLAVLTQLFPSLFGQPAIPMTDADWVKMFPGNGYWTSLYRNYIKSKIPNTRDLWRLERFTGYFVWDNRQNIAPEVPSSCYPYDNPHLCPQVMAKFFALLKQEQRSGGNQPIGIFPGGLGSIDPTTLLLIGGGVLLLVMLNKKKKKRSRK